MIKYGIILNNMEIKNFLEKYILRLNLKYCNNK